MRNVDVQSLEVMLIVEAKSKLFDKDYKLEMIEKILTQLEQEFDNITKGK